MFESSEVKSGGMSTAAAAIPEVPATTAPVKEGEGGTSLEDAP